MPISSQNVLLALNWILVILLGDGVILSPTLFSHKIGYVFGVANFLMLAEIYVDKLTAPLVHVKHSASFVIFVLDLKLARCASQTEFGKVS